MCLPSDQFYYSQCRAGNESVHVDGQFAHVVHVETIDVFLGIYSVAYLPLRNVPGYRQLYQYAIDFWVSVQVFDLR